MTTNGTINGRTPVKLIKLPEPLPVEKPTAKPEPSVPPRDARWKRSARWTWRAATHERTRDGARAAVRHGMYVAGGTRIVWHRARDGRTAARYERMMRIAEASGDADRIAEWEERGRTWREQRHRRRKEMLSTLREAPKVAAAGLGTGAGGLVLLGAALAWEQRDIGAVAAPTLFVIDLLGWLAVIGSVVWGLAKLFALPVIGLALWDVGRRQEAAPAWALPAAKRQRSEETITPSVVVTAFKNLGISDLRKSILAMEDGGAAMLSPIVLAGCGVEVDVHLPMGSTTNEIQARRKKLAENLHRHEHEVYITIPPAARTVRLWIADSGTLDEPVPESPLVYDESLTADYKNGRAPWGLDLRGDAVLVSLYQMMLLVTGLSNQGKTAALRALALWLAFDPRVEFRIGDLKGIGDWRMWLGLATVLVEGPTNDDVMAVTHMVEDAFDEMNRRLTSGEKDFPPLVIIVDEAQVAYTSDAKGPDGRPYGGAKATSRYFQAVKRIHDQGRAVNVTIWEGTQDPTNQNLPERSREGNHIRASLVVGTESKAKMALGEDPVDAGAAPHKLRRGVDRGQLVVTGDGIDMPAGQVFINVRTHFVDTDRAGEVAERIKARRKGVTTQTQVEAAEERDHLADIATVLRGEERVLTVEVATRLAALDDQYKDWDAAKVKAVLVEAGTNTKKSSRSWVILDWVLEALRARDDDPE